MAIQMQSISMGRSGLTKIQYISRNGAADADVDRPRGGHIQIEGATGMKRTDSDLRHGRRSRASLYFGIDFRAEPSRYVVGRGEEGVLTAEPYKSELLPMWAFRTPVIARRSAIKLWNAFVRYRRAGDFVGMDLARKFLQMGFTRARRYANHRSGQKYAPDGSVAPRSEDPEKAAAALQFYERWQRAEKDAGYRRWRLAQKTRITK